MMRMEGGEMNDTTYRIGWGERRWEAMGGGEMGCDGMHCDRCCEVSPAIGRFEPHQIP